MRFLLLLPSLLVACKSEGVTVKDDTAGGGEGDSDTDTDTDSDTDTGAVVSGAISVSPSSLSFETVFVGGTANMAVTVENVGDGPVALVATVNSATSAEYATAFSATAPDPGTSATLTLTLTPTDWGDHAADLTITDSTGTGHVVVPVSAWVQVDDDGDGFGSDETGGKDCNDGDAAINPAAEEVWYDGIDSDCGGGDDYDQDGDGHAVDDDCDDTDASIHPGATETWYDGVDGNCDGANDYDQDGDGVTVDTDCDDEDATVNPGATEVWYNGVDENCDGKDDDQDSDGYNASDDCNDTDATINPAATDTWYDGVDTNCDGADDYDQDADGITYDDDCDDTDASAGARETEVWDGIDNDCDGTVDDISISDAASGALYGATASIAIGTRNGLSLGGDLTGDGVDDLVVATPSSGYGYAWVVEGTTAASSTGSITDYDTAQLSGGSASYLLNSVVGPMRDLDGDGDSDLLVDGYSTTTYGYYTYAYGRAYMEAGGSALSGSITVSSTYRAYFTGDSDYDGMRFIAAGDVDGDGSDDIVTGCPYDSDGSSYYSYYQGNIAVFSGGSFSGSYDLGDADDQIAGENSSDYLGTSVVLADLDGDGLSDIIAGASGEDSGASGAGAIYLFSGNASMEWDSSADDAMTARIVASTASAGLGADSLPDQGDLNGDGTLDVAFTSSTLGAAYVFFDGSSLAGSMTTASADLTVSGTAGAFANSIAVNSDLDGDGTDELLIGASGDDTIGTNAGAVFLFNASAGTGAWTSANAEASIYGAAAGDALGSGLAGGGDADADGMDDVVAGATGNDTVASGGGAVYVIPGR